MFGSDWNYLRIRFKFLPRESKLLLGSDLGCVQMRFLYIYTLFTAWSYSVTDLFHLKDICKIFAQIFADSKDIAHICIVIVSKYVFTIAKR